jgi:hypothetical protein
MQLLSELICWFTHHHWPLDTGLCKRCGEVCTHRLAVRDTRWHSDTCGGLAVTPKV